jgi:hypothetical protein
MTPISELLPNDQHLFQQDFHQLGNADTIQGHLWVASMKSAIHAASHIATGHYTPVSLQSFNSIFPNLLPANLCSKTLKALNGTAPLHAGNFDKKLSLHLSGYPIVPRPMYLLLHSPIKLISQEFITACIGSENKTFDESRTGQP